MTTTMENAMKEAGITIPQNKRIWTYLKDHPGSTGAAIAAALKIPANNVSTLCADMVKRGMLEQAEQRMRVPMGRGFGERYVLFYSVSPKLRGEYELLPMPKKPKPPAQEQAEVAENVTLPEKTPFVPVFNPEAFVQPLKLAEVKELYVYLRNFFN